MTRDFTTNRARVLIAEDHALVREGLRAVLSGEPDLEVVGEAENGKRALELCRSLSPELVLMDVRMPEMDGLKATRKIKEAHLEVIVLRQRRSFSRVTPSGVALLVTANVFMPVDRSHLGFARETASAIVSGTLDVCCVD